MTFQTDLELFYSTEQIKQWSNPGNDTGATTPDASVISGVERLVKGKFLTLAGVEYDEDNDAHLEPAMRHAGDLLRSYASGLGFFGESITQSEDAIRQIRFIDHSNTITPAKSNANKIPIGDTNESAFDSYTFATNGFPSIRRNPNYYDDQRYT